MMRQLEKNVEMGFEKLPEKEKEKMRLEEKRKAEDELKSTQEDLWKLKSREKKIVTSETAARIKKINEFFAENFPTEKIEQKCSMLKTIFHG